MSINTGIVCQGGGRDCEMWCWKFELGLVFKILCYAETSTAHL